MRVSLEDCGNVVKHYGDTFHMDIGYEYSLDRAQDLRLLLFVNGVLYGDSGPITKNGTDSDGISMQSLPINLSPGTYDVSIRLYMGDVGSNSGGLEDTYTCTGALTIT